MAIPEELLFRALIQDWLMQRFGFTDRLLALAAVIFGSAHLNSAPGPLPKLVLHDPGEHCRLCLPESLLEILHASFLAQP